MGIFYKKVLKYEHNYKKQNLSKRNEPRLFIMEVTK